MYILQVYSCKSAVDHKQLLYSRTHRCRHTDFHLHWVHNRLDKSLNWGIDKHHSYWYIFDCVHMDFSLHIHWYLSGVVEKDEKKNVKFILRKFNKRLNRFVGRFFHYPFTFSQRRYHRKKKSWWEEITWKSFLGEELRKRWKNARRWRKKVYVSVPESF